MKEIINLLHADACIIDEAGDHLVLAVRLPKAVVTENHALLAALSERAGSVSVPRRAPPSLARKTTFRTMPIAACLAIVLVPMLPHWSQASKSPIQMLRSELIHRVVHSGEQLQLAIEGRRDRACPTFAENTYTAANGTTYTDNDPSGGLPIASAPSERIFEIELPGTLPYGDYTLNRTIFTACGNQTFADSVATNLPFSYVR